MASLNDIEKILQRKLQKALNSLPTVLVNEAVNWTKDNFSRQGFPTESFQSWPPRKDNKKSAGRAILVKTGRLKRSVRMISTGPLRATFGTEVPYARAQNDGFHGMVTVATHQRNKIGTIKMSTGKSNQKFKTKKTIVGRGTVKSHQRNMNLPRRRFIGNSPVLRSILRKKAIVHIGRELKS